MAIETNGPALIIKHLEGCEMMGEPVDVKFIEEIAWVTDAYMSQLEMGGKPWHEVREQWLKDNPKHSERWGR